MEEILMRVFAPGATGYIGSAVVRELLGTGHQVLGLARSDAAAAALIAAGAAEHRGDLSDLESLRDGAATADGVIHMAFNNFSETTDMAASVQADLRAVETIGTALEGSGKPFVVTSVTFLLARLGRLGTEEDVSDSAVPRAAAENAAIALAERGVRSSVVRNALTVHGEGVTRRSVSILIAIARAKAVSSFAADATTRGPAGPRL